jgi:hypothetical protein
MEIKLNKLEKHLTIKPKQPHQAGFHLVLDQ